jgi:hypothetical protein
MEDTTKDTSVMDTNGANTNTNADNNGDATVKDNTDKKSVETKTDNTPEKSTWIDDVTDKPKIVGRDGEVLADAESVNADDSKSNKPKDSKTDDPDGKEDDDGDFTIPEEIELKVNGKIEKFSLKDKKQVEKLIEYGQKGRYTEQISLAKKEYEEQKTLVEQQLDKLTYAYLLNVHQGKIQLEEPKKEDYTEADGKYYTNFKDDDEAQKGYKSAVENFESTMKMVKQFGSQAQESYKQYQTTQSEFQKEHPEIKDFKQFLVDHVNPLVKPLLSFGAEPLPKKLLDAIYFYVYKDEIINKAIENDRKKLADDKPNRSVGNVRVKTPDVVKDDWGKQTTGKKIVFR